MSQDDLVNERGWIWNPERLQTVRDVKLKWSSLPKNEYSNSLLTISADGSMVVRSGYIWDGATSVPTGKYLSKEESENLPIISLTDNPIPSEWKATLRHDISYDFMHDMDEEGRSFPYSRRKIDAEFYIDLEQNGFSFSKIYYAGVRFFGILYARGVKTVSSIIDIIRSR